MNNCKKMLSKIFIIGVFFIVVLYLPVEAAVSFTPEEKLYIAEQDVLKAVTIGGAAPIQYIDSNGEINGISKEVLSEISDMTGLTIDYEIYNTMEEALESGFDIFFGMTLNYTSEDMVLSHPFLKSETILYINSSLDSTRLDDKLYAAVKGGILPEGIKEENTIYFNTREESINAVELGRADYGYGNSYSIAFYTIQNGYNNIVAIPRQKESREYCMGIKAGNELLFSIVNKSIDSIDEGRIQDIILNETMHIERKITPSMILRAYGKEIIFVSLLALSVLLYSFISYIRINKKLRIQNRRHERLAQISNEYLYEYSPKDDRLELSDKCVRLFGMQEVFYKVSDIMKSILSGDISDGYISMIRLPLADGEERIFKAVNSIVRDDYGRVDSIMGKLIDISKEVAEKEELLMKSQIDGLTGLYNATTTKELIVDRIRSKDKHKTDALILLDCDNFKNINDTLGHLTGNQVLEDLGRSLKITFRSTDIIGRIGGDEFCIYMKDIPSAEFIHAKCEQLSRLVKKIMEKELVSVSIGVAIVNEEKSYEDLFKKADDNMYTAKRKGRDQFYVYDTE